jgi:hypothetical protein
MKSIVGFELLTLKLKKKRLSHKIKKNVHIIIYTITCRNFQN